MNHKYKPGDLINIGKNGDGKSVLAFITDIYKLTPFIDQYVCYDLQEPDTILKIYTRDIDEPDWQLPKVRILGEQE